MRWAWVGLSLLAGCAEEPAPLTQLVLVARTDMPELRRVRFRVEQGDKRAPPSESYLTLDTPAYVSVVDASGTRGPIVVSASGFDAQGRTVVRQRAEVSFVRHATRALELQLSEVCRDVYLGCERAGETCVEGACRPLARPTEPWSGPPLSDGDAGAGVAQVLAGDDAGAGEQPDAGGDGQETDASRSDRPDDGPDAPGPVLCDGEVVDTSRDSDHCGACGEPCAGASAALHELDVCRGGKCRIACMEGWADCKPGKGPNEGCETRLGADCLMCSGGCSDSASR